MKLHLGCGHNLLAGWINVDAWPIPGREGFTVVHHDLARGLPYPDGSADFIFTEHFLEHIERDEALVLLRDCRRVLRLGGVMRIVVPDLAHLVQKYVANDLDWGGAGGWQPANRCVMMNQGFRAWGHKHLYDAEELVRILGEAGFREVKSVPWRESVHPALHALEVRPKVGDLRVEATK